MEGWEGRSVSCDGDGERRLERLEPNKPRGITLCCCTSNESVLYLRVVGSSFAIVLFSALPLMFVFELVRDNGRFLLDRFIITTPSSDEESSSRYFAHGLWLNSSSSSSSTPLHSTAMHCSTFSSKRMCFLSP